MHYSSVHAGHKIRSVMLQTLIGHLKNTAETYIYLPSVKLILLLPLEFCKADESACIN